MTTSDNQDHVSGRAGESVAEIDLMNIFRDIWGAKYLIAALLAVAILVALFSLALGRKQYTAQAILGPAESSAQSSSMGQLAGAASLFGVRMGPGGNSDFVKFQEILHSERLAEALYENRALRPVWFGPLWSQERNTWVRPSGAVFETKEFVKSLLGRSSWKAPDSFSVQADLKAKLDVLSDKVTGFATVSIEDDSPTDAAYVLQTIIATADDLIRQGIKDRAKNRITYLSGALQNTSVQDQREAMITLLSAQEKTMMMASTDKTYAIDIVDPPAASPIPTSPKPGQTILSYCFFALFAGSIYAALRGYLRRRRGNGRAAAREPSIDKAILDWMRNRRASGVRASL